MNVRGVPAPQNRNVDCPHAHLSRIPMLDGRLAALCRTCGRVVEVEPDPLRGGR